MTAPLRPFAFPFSGYSWVLWLLALVVLYLAFVPRSGPFGPAGAGIPYGPWSYPF